MLLESMYGMSWGVLFQNLSGVYSSRNFYIGPRTITMTINFGKQSRSKFTPVHGSFCGSDWQLII